MLDVARAAGTRILLAAIDTPLIIKLGERIILKLDLVLYKRYIPSCKSFIYNQ
jgi:hypothetical protein